MRNGLCVAFALLCLGFSAICLVSCTAKKAVFIHAGEKLVKVLEPMVIKEENPLTKPIEHLVARDECLWTISKLYKGDPFLWPILWKANRDYILDPDWIEAGERIVVPGRVQEDDIDWARSVSADWPKQGRPRSLTKP